MGSCNTCIGGGNNDIGGSGGSWISKYSRISNEIKKFIILGLFIQARQVQTWIKVNRKPVCNISTNVTQYINTIMLCGSPRGYFMALSFFKSTILKLLRVQNVSAIFLFTKCNCLLLQTFLTRVTISEPWRQFVSFEVIANLWTGGSFYSTC